VTGVPSHARRALQERRRAPERALAWLYTGPLGHLYGLLADVAVLWFRYTRSRVRARAR
jgi:hypothetical protein